MKKMMEPGEPASLASGPELSASEFRQISRMAYEYAGLDLGDNKTQLVATRLGKKLRQMQLGSYGEYCRHVMEDGTGEALIGMIDALTTNHTSFLREQAHFDFLARDVLPQMSGGRRVTIWSAACSTGEEPYSIAFSVLEALGAEGASRVKILATDISTKALATAGQGIYPMDRMRGMPREWLSRYLLRGNGRWEGQCQVKRWVRELVEFRRQNLMESFAHVGPFEVIFCRNVMIYFDQTTQQDLVRRMAARLEPGGYLFTGHAESLNGLDHPLRYVKPAIYRRVLEDGTAASRGKR